MSKPLEAVVPPDCYARAQLIAAEVELIRAEMGRPRDQRLAATTRGAAPREVYFEALALFRKADRLCYEQTGDATANVPHAPPIMDIRPGHVLQVLDAALGELRETKARLGIAEVSQEPAADPSKQPSDVLGAVVTINRQLNLLLERPWAPGDVYQQISLASAYAARLLSRLPGASTTPVVPGYVRRKRPGDVYTRLVSCLDKLRQVATAAGLAMAEQAPSAGSPEEVVPADVYDAASLVLAELAYLHAHGVDANPPYPFEANTPGRKLPSHCFQLCGVLEGQLDELRRVSEGQQGWLRK